MAQGFIYIYIYIYVYIGFPACFPNGEMHKNILSVVSLLGTYTKNRTMSRHIYRNNVRSQLLSRVQCILLYRSCGLITIHIWAEWFASNVIPHQRQWYYDWGAYVNMKMWRVRDGQSDISLDVSRLDYRAYYKWVIKKKKPNKLGNRALLHANNSLSAYQIISVASV